MLSESSESMPSLDEATRIAMERRARTKWRKAATFEEAGNRAANSVLTPEFVRVVRLAVMGVASRMPFSYDDIEDIKLAVSEACNNAILHARVPFDQAQIALGCGRLRWRGTNALSGRRL